ncbi:MAG: YcaO-like family protein [Deltaproteobacteria bacterium]|nr:YcaO-like family protein [Deltaproteobacteria bacterium]
MVRTPPPTSGIVLHAVTKGYDREQDKLRPPGETVAWVKERFAVLGEEVHKKTVRVDTGRLGIPVYLSLCGPAASALTGTAKQMGKGASPVQAEASALMELAERYSFFHFMRHTNFPLLTAAQVPPEALDFAQAAKAVHHPPADLARAREVYELLPQRWAWARNLTTLREEYLPLSWFFAINEYNGPAAGNCQEEAVLQSLCEVVERHVSAVVTNRSLATPAIDPASICDPVAQELLAKFAQAGVEVHLRDYTCGMGIPSVGALCYDPATFPAESEIVYTAGTATSPAKALIRALTEVAQLAGDFAHRTSYKVSALPKFANLAEAAYVLNPDGVVDLASLPDLADPDFNQEIAACVAALEARDFTVYCLDVTHPALGVPAVYTIIPGAHFAQRTTGTDVFFHAAKLASQLPDPCLAREVLDSMGRVTGAGYQLFFFRALALVEEGRPAEALELLDQAQAMNPPPADLASILVHKGVALKDLGRPAEAKEVLLAAAAMPEPHHEVFNLLGYCHYLLKEHQEAIEAFARAVEIEPGAAINYANIGSNLRELGRWAEAASMYEHALELDPGLDWARTNLAKMRAKLAAEPGS